MIMQSMATGIADHILPLGDLFFFLSLSLLRLPLLQFVGLNVRGDIFDDVTIDCHVEGSRNWRRGSFKTEGLGA